MVIRLAAPPYSTFEPSGSGGVVQKSLALLREETSTAVDNRSVTALTITHAISCKVCIFQVAGPADIFHGAEQRIKEFITVGEAI